MTPLRQTLYGLALLGALALLLWSTYQQHQAAEAKAERAAQVDAVYEHQQQQPRREP